MKELKIESPVNINDIDKLKSQAYDRIMNDKIVQRFIKKNEIPLSFISDNLGLFLRMVEENEPCLKCKGFKDCKKHNLQKGYLTFVSPDESVYYEECKYYREYLEIANLYEISDFDKELMFCNYTDKDLVDAPSKSLYTKILLSIVHNKNLYISSKENMDIVMELLISAINRTIKQTAVKKRVAVINATTLRDKADKYNRFEQDQFYKLKDSVSNADILVINSLGSEEKSEFFRYSFLMDLITYRGSHNLTTIVSSYYKLSELKEVYGGYNLMNKTQLLIDKLNEYFDIEEFMTILKK